MNKTSTPQKTARVAAIIALSCWLFLSGQLNAQQAFCTWSGASNQQNCCGGLAAPPCGSTGQVSNIGSGTFTYLTLTAGRTYTFSNVGTSGTFGDSQMSLWYYYGGGNHNGNNGGWGPVSWADDNGPDGAGTMASFTITAPYTSTQYILVVNRFNCIGHNNAVSGGASPYGSAIIKYREEGTPTLTATAGAAACPGTNTVSLSMGGTCLTHTMTAGMYERFNTASVALNYADYTPRWVKNGDAFVRDDGLAYFVGSAVPAWGSSGMNSVQAVSRVEGRVLQGRWWSDGGYTMLGWKQNTTDYNYTTLAHAFYPHPSGIQIYENGAYRADVTSIANTIGGGYGNSRWIEWKIVLHSGAANNGGATYYLKGSSGDWVVVFHSNNGTASPLKFGISKYDAPRLYLDDVFMGGATQFPATSGLSAGTYSYAAQDQHGSVATASATITGLPAFPGMPTQSPASNIGCTTAQANWLAGARATGYDVQVATDAGFTNVIQNIAVGNVTATTISGLVAGNQYHYRVRSKNSCGTTGYTLRTEVNMLPADPGRPAPAAATNVGCNSFQANWNAQPLATNYRLDVARDDQFTNMVYSNISTGNATSYNVTGLVPGDPYYYRLRSTYTCGTSINSQTVLVTMPPAAGTPTSNAITGITCNSFNASWSSAANATGYFIDVATDLGFAPASMVYNGAAVGNVTSYTVSVPSAGTTYYFRVRAGNICGQFANSATQTAVMLPATPAVPAQIAASGIGCSAFTANWGSSANTTSYLLDIATTSNFTAGTFLAHNLSVGTATSYTQAGIAGSTYYYRVRAQNVCGTSGYSTTTTVNMLPATPAIPAAAAASSITCTSFIANWGSSANTSAYLIDVSTDSNFGSYLPGWFGASLGSTAVTVSGLSAGEVYYYRVRASNSCGTSASSSVITATMPPATPAVPSATVASNIGCNSFQANWSTVANASGYYLEVATNSGFTSFVPGWNNTLLGSVGSANIGGLTNGTTYFYRVKATNSCGTSLISSSVSVTTLPPAPVVPSANAASSVECNSFAANWILVPNATSYIVDVSDDVNFTTFLPGWNGNVLGAQSTVSVTGLITGATYHYRVRASNSCGTSINSNRTSVTLNSTPVLTSCPGDITFNNDPSQCASVVNYSSAIAAGVPAPSISYSHSSGSVFPLGLTNVVVTAQNACGVATCDFDVTVVDNEPPTIICPDQQVLPLDASCSVSLPDYIRAATIFDNCSQPLDPGLPANQQAPGHLNVTQDPPVGTMYYGVGVVEVTLTAVDSTGNLNSCSFFVSFEDFTAPEAICQDLTIDLDESGYAGISYDQIDGGSYDNCFDIGNIYLDIQDFTCDNVGDNIVTLYVEDIYGNLGECQATVTVQDFVGPEAYCQDAWVELDESGYAFISPEEIDGGSYDPCGVDFLDASQYDFDCSMVGDNVVTLYVYDIYGNVSECDAIVNVADYIAAEAICQDITIQLDAAGAASIVAEDIDGGSNDACGIASLEASQTDFDCSHVGANTTTLTVTDVNGNVSSCDATVTVEDNVPAEAICQDITIQLDAAGAASIVAEDIDGGSNDACGIASLDASQYDFDCSHVGANALTLTVTDVNGNVSSCGATVTVEDNVPAEAICQDVTIYLDTLGNASITTLDIDGGSNDACGIASLDASQYNFDCSNAGGVSAGANTVTLTVTDVNGNISSCDATVTVLDEYAPTAICQGISIELDALGDASITPEMIDNSSWDACGIKSLSLDITTFTCSNVGNNTVLLTVTDLYDNVSSCFGTVTVFDNVQPVAECQDVNVYLDAAGNGSITPQQVDNGSNDACGIASLSVSPNTFDCTKVGPNPVILTVTDVNGNISVCDANTQVYDLVAPVAICQPTTIQLNALGQAYLTPNLIDGGSNDACGIQSLAISKEEFGCGDVGQNIVTLSVEDANGNLSECDAIVTVQDKVPATAICQNLTIELDAAGLAYVTADMLDAGSYDNCGIDNLDADITTFDCSNVGSNNTVILTITDVNGNESTCTSTITVQDNIAPTAICQEVTVTLDAFGFASVTAAQVNDGSFDNCGIASMTVSPNTFGCANIGSNAVILTVTDVNNNVTTCANNVKVIGTIPTCFITPLPANNTFTGGVPTNIYLGYGPQTVTLQTTMTGGTPQFYSWTGSNLSCYNCANPVFAPTATGVYNFTVTVTNNFGCITTCSITICVLDVRASGGKVRLAHVVGGSGNTGFSCNNLTVSTNAIAAHLAHGDYLGLCNGTGTQICQTSAKTDEEENDGMLAASESEDFSVRVFPNPFSDVFRLKVSSSSDDNLNVRIYDVLGQLIMEKTGVAFASDITFGNNLSKGVYLVEVTQGERMSVLRVIKSE